MKLSRNTVLWLLVVASIAFSLVGLFYAYYYGWLLALPGISEEDQRRYESLSRIIGIPSMILFFAALVEGIWLFFRKCFR
ncbi:hypothetical protein ACFIQG_06950 [Comamonas odontotermitis]|uniref:hypothetical protein n=1 Tax=Comamonas odontotermitis TaxID=379895 RepID=UPI0036726A09